MTFHRFFPADDPHVQYSAVSSFVFLRFFAVAVVSPHTFHLRPHHPVSVVLLKALFHFYLFLIKKKMK